MTDTKQICEAIKGLSHDAQLRIELHDDGGVYATYGSISGNDLKSLVAENEALRQKLNCIAFYAKDHDEPKSHCALCLIEGVVSGDILPIETAHGGNDE